MSSSDRIDGWKAIAAHFNRDRTTAMRWAQTRALPVRRIPGGKRATVYALKSDLDRWASSHADVVAGTDTSAAPSQAPRPKRLIWAAVLVVVTVLVAAIGGVMMIKSGEAPETAGAAVALPRDPSLAPLYLQARDDWAQRTPESLARAIAALTTIARREPTFAPAHASLAEAYLLQREFGAMPDKAAFASARQAARVALDLDPDLGSAHRAMGFVQYWADNDPTGAGRSFRRAVELTPDSAQTHFWYGNVLADNGQAEAAARELNRARLIEPGSIAIQVDLAWADWSAGRESEAVVALERLMRTAPDFAVIHDCLAIIRLSRGDYPGYVAAYAEYARLRDDPDLLAHARSLEHGLVLGLPEVQSRIAARAATGAATQDGRNHAWPTFVASVAGDRASLVEILTGAAERRERWGSAGLRAAVARRWAMDAEIIGLLARVKPPLLE